MSTIIRSICCLMIMALAAKQSQCKDMPPFFDEDPLAGINHIGMLPDAETAHKYMQRALAVLEMVKGWGIYLQKLATRLFGQIFSVFGLENTGAEKSLKKISYKTWLAIQEEMPQYFKDMYVQIEHVYYYLTSGLDAKQMSKLMDFMH